LKKNIAIIINDINDNGAARVVSNLSLNLPNDKYRKTIIITDYTIKGYPIDGDLIDLNVKGSNSFLKKIFNTFIRIRKVKKIKRQKEIDTTISFLPNPNLVNILSKRKEKVIISVRNFMSKSLSSSKLFIYKKVIKHLYNKAHLIVAVSEAIKLDLIKNFGVNEDKIIVIHNFYDIKNIREDSIKKLSLKKQNIFKQPTIITSGRLSNQKGQWHLIRAFSKVKEKIPNAQLVILGKGDLKSKLIDITYKLKLENSIHFLGFQSNPFKYIAEADIFVLPSLYEGFPNALCEAMACGLPVISTDCQSGPREILEPCIDIEVPTIKKTVYGSYGILVPVFSELRYLTTEELTKEEIFMEEAIIELLENEDKMYKYKLKSIERIDHFNISNVIENWINII